MASFPIKVHDAYIGTTLRFTFVNSGVTPSLISSALIDKNETLVNSLAAVSSGNGFYYAPHTMPTTPGWYLNQWTSWVNSFPYISRQMIRVRTMETD